MELAVSHHTPQISVRCSDGKAETRMVTRTEGGSRRENAESAGGKEGPSTARGVARSGGSSRAAPKVDGWRSQQEEPTDDEQAKIEAFIRTKGVTKCPAPFSPEMKALHLKRELDWQAMSQQERAIARGWFVRRPKRPVTSGEHDTKRLRRNAYMREYNARKKLEVRS